MIHGKIQHYEFSLWNQDQLLASQTQIREFLSQQSAKKSKVKCCQIVSSWGGASDIKLREFESQWMGGSRKEANYLVEIVWKR